MGGAGMTARWALALLVLTATVPAAHAGVLDWPEARRVLREGLVQAFDPANGPHAVIRGRAITLLERYRDARDRTCVRYRVAPANDGTGREAAVCRDWARADGTLVRADGAPAASAPETTTTSAKAGPMARFERRALAAAALLLVPLGWLVWSGWFRK